LRGELAGYDRLEESTRRSLLAAEYLYDQIVEAGLAADLSRPSGFSYAFAVENEAKARLGARVRRFVEDAGTPALLRQMLEARGDRISIFYERYLLRALRGYEAEVTPENFFHAFTRILEHGPRYRPDGLKALGMMVIAFGRFYSFTRLDEEVEVYNPLKLSGLTDSDAALRFGVELINLQHARNPFIHPDLGDPIPTGSMRTRSIALLRALGAT
jgi:hypothetical protein